MTQSTPADHGPVRQGQTGPGHAPGPGQSAHGPGHAVGPVPAESIAGMEFPASKYGRGYERRAVRDFLEQMAGVVVGLQHRVQAAEAEVGRLQQRVIEGPRGEEVIQAVSVISNAQRTADAIIAEANSYSSRVMSEAHETYDDARRRSAQLEQDAEQHVQEITLSTRVHQDELDKQTVYLRTLRDATRAQMQAFLEGMLFHVADEYGRAHPSAAQAAEADRPISFGGNPEQATKPLERDPRREAEESGAAESGAADPGDVESEADDPKALPEAGPNSPNGLPAVAPGR